MVTSHRCAHCGVKLRGAPSFCPSCGARLVRTGDADGAEVELDLVERGSAPVDSEVVFERPSGRRGKGIGLGVMTALAVAIGASVLSGGDDGRTATPTSTTVDPGPTTAAEPPATTSVTAAIASTTSTTLGPFYVAPGPLLGEPTGLSLAVAFGTDLYVIDADTGRATPAGYGNVNQGQTSALTSVGVVIGDVNGTPDLLRRGATRSERLVLDRPDDASELAGPSVFVGEGPPGRLWVMRYGGPRPIVGYVEAGTGSADLVKLGHVDAIYGATRADGIGGFLFSSAGGTYRIDESGAPRRLSPGVMLDAGDGHALVVECDDTFTCGYRGIDVATGESWTFTGAGPVSLADTTSLVLSPDGRRFARLAAFGIGEPVALGEATAIDIVGVDGTETIRAPISGFGACGIGGCASPLVWSSDGRWLLSLRSSDSVWAWRSGLDEALVIELPDDAPVPQARFSLLVGVRPTDAMPVGPA